MSKLHIQPRFDNFKLFVESEAPYSMAAFMLKPIGLEAFLEIIAKMKAEYKGEDDPTSIAMHVLGELYLDPKDFTAEALQRFTLYCEYFMTVIAD